MVPVFLSKVNNLHINIFPPEPFQLGNFYSYHHIKLEKDVSAFETKELQLIDAQVFCEYKKVTNKLIKLKKKKS